MLRAHRFHLDHLPHEFFHDQGRRLHESLRPLFLDQRHDRITPMDLCESTLLATLRLLKKTPWRGVPGPALEALRFWRRHPERLLFSEEAFSPWDVLHLQSRGLRCVTLFGDLESWLRPESREKDPIAFLLHDLVHAQRFFLGPIPHEIQVRTSQTCLRLRGLGLLAELENSAHHRTGLEYAVSDMNTHPAHQLAYLSFLELDRRKKRLGLTAKDRLPPEEETSFREWNSILRSELGQG